MKTFADYEREYEAIPSEPVPSPDPVRSTWSVLKIIAVILAGAQAIGFASFIWEESLQCAGFSVKVAFDARDCDQVESTLSRLETMQASASAWQGCIGWLCPWMHFSFRAYFDDAVRSQIRSYRALQKLRCPDQAWLEPVPVHTNITTFVRMTPAEPKPVEIETQLVTYARSAPATEQFWTQWRKSKEKMKAQGYSVMKTNGQWIVTRTSP